MVPDPDAAEIVITGEMAATVRRWQPEYTGTRLVGTVEGKVVPKPGGGLVLVLPCWSLLSTAPPWPETRHTVLHEAFHVATWQRNERLDELPAQHSGNGQAWLLARVVAQAVEEYRVERAAIESGRADLAPRRDSLSEHLDEFRALLRAAVDPIRRSTDEQGMLKAGFRIFTEIAHEIAWVVAADVATEGELVPDESDGSWRRLIGRHYAPVREALRRIPSAADAASRSELEDSASELIPVFAEWLEFIGFITGDDGHGGPRMGLVRTDY